MDTTECLRRHLLRRVQARPVEAAVDEAPAIPDIAAGHPLLREAAGPVVSVAAALVAAEVPWAVADPRMVEEVAATPEDQQGDVVPTDGRTGSQA